MNGKISLTASMRSNLLSLQNISRQVSSTQNKLATGNKVNSAIDNPSSYYTARSLNNRADDLNALLDSMGQAVSTIKAATTALEAGAEFLEQAVAVANQALEGNAAGEAPVPDGAVLVKNEADLRAAVANADNKEIIISGNITLTSKIELAEGQKLSGIQAYDSSQSGKLTFNFSADVTEATGIELGDNSQVSHLDIDYTNAADITDILYDSAASYGAVSVITYRGDQAVYLDNLNINGTSSYDVIGIFNDHGQTVLNGNININLNGKAAMGIAGNSDAVILDEYNIIQQSDNVLMIKTQGTDSTVGIFGAIAELNGTSYYDGYIGMFGVMATVNGELNVTVPADEELFYYAELSVSAAGRLNLSSTNPDGWAGKFAAGAVVMNPDGVYQVLNDTEDNNTSSADFQRIGDYDPSLLTPPAGSSRSAVAAAAPTVSAADSGQYQSILHQYDSLIKDASYKGINLLQDNVLNVKFNETGNSALSVKGKDMLSGKLGVSHDVWKTQEDITRSINELTAALRSIRSFSAELGNNYSIITSRQDFTENLINILTEGADKLTLADMNEESANMLALQTRQQLAINSLSLASQASQAVLKLF